MLLWMFNNLFYTTFIVGALFAFGGSLLYLGQKQLRQAKANGQPVSPPRRLLLAIICGILLGIGVVGFVLALYADYIAQGTIINHWASAFIVGTILIALLYGTLPSVGKWLDKRMRNEK